MDEKKNNDKTDNNLSNFFKIAGGLTIISFAFPFVVNYFFSDWSKSGAFGSTFGASNTLFSGLALAGVIITIIIQKKELENQRKEMQLQRDEMQQTRKEFLISRTTNLVYSQLDRFEKCLKELTINHSGSTYVGNDAISYLDKNKNTVFLGDNEEIFKANKKRSTIALLKIYAPNKSEIEKFAHNAYNSIEVLKRLIFKTELEVEELHDIKKLFFVNIGFINMGIIERITEVCNDEIIYLEAQDYIDHSLDVGELQRANIFLRSINKFYTQRLTNENFEALKEKWKESQGQET